MIQEEVQKMFDNIFDSVTKEDPGGSLAMRLSAIVYSQENLSFRHPLTQFLASHNGG